VADKTSETSPDETVANETNTATDETPDETTTAADETTTAADEASETADETTTAADEASETADETTADEPGETTDETSAVTDETTADETGETSARRIRLAAIVLGAATVVLAGFGVWATLEAHSLRADAAPQNIAVTDAAATRAVSRQITSAVNTVFSYNYADTAATRQAAQNLLTGPAIQQYNTYFALVTKDAPSQKLVVTTRVTNSGVELLDGNQARVLVFANQQDTRAGTRQSSYAGALFAVTAVRQGSRWRIENIDTFNGQ
jgi:Mce-associated membrane protein